MNPNASGFRPGAPAFQPTGGGPPPLTHPNPHQQQPQGQPQYGGFDAGPGYGGYASQGAYGGQYGQPGGYGGQYPGQGAQGGSYGGYQGGYGYPGQSGGYYPSPPNQGYGSYQTPNASSSQAPDSWEEAAAPPAPVKSRNEPGSGSVDKPAVVSLSIGSKKTAPATAIAKKEGKAGSDKGSAPASRSETPPPSNLKKAASKVAAPALAPTVSQSSAQSSTGGKSMTLGGAPIKRHVKDADAIAKEVEAAVDEETLQDLYKHKADVVPEGKAHINVVFIGHVDAGKSTMGGQILFLSGMVDKRTMEKYEREAKEAGRESWYLSWALDSTSQEREKGKTVEVGRAYFETESRRYTILDAPGHKTYVPAMISGAAQADVALLVISARKGEFETGFERGGQTREHAMLVKTAGVGKLVVVVNKMDDTTVEWDKERFDEIKMKLGPFLKGAGFAPNDVTWVPASAYSGANIKERVSKSVCPWSDGPSLFELLDSIPLGDRKFNGPLMIPISEKYKDMGAIVVGKIESGRVEKGDQVMMMPNRALVEVAGIFGETEEEIPRAFCGDNVRIRLKGIEDEDVTVGFVLSSRQKPVSSVTRFEAQLAILDSKNIVCAGYGAVMHVHTLSEEVTLTALLHYYDKKTGKKSRRAPQFAKKGMKVVAMLETTAPVCLEPFKEYPQLGRFTLRDEGKTIAIGKVTKLVRVDDDLSEMTKLSLASSSAASNASPVVA